MIGVLMEKFSYDDKGKIVLPKLKGIKLVYDISKDEHFRWVDLSLIEQLRCIADELEINADPIDFGNAFTEEEKKILNEESKRLSELAEKYI